MSGVLVTGAAGGVGHRLCLVLRRHGFAVRGLVRPEDDTRWLELPAADVHVGNVRDPEAVCRPMHGLEAVVHCAALLSDALERDRAPFQAVNVEGTRNVMRHAMIRPVEMRSQSFVLGVAPLARRTGAGGHHPANC